jgi:hypothetical protein
MNRYRPKAGEDPATGRRPNPNHQYFWPIRFADAFEYHPQLALAFTGELTDTWVPYSDPAEVMR